MHMIFACICKRQSRVHYVSYHAILSSAVIQTKNTNDNNIIKTTRICGYANRTSVMRKMHNLSLWAGDTANEGLSEGAGGLGSLTKEDVWGSFPYFVGSSSTFMTPVGGLLDLTIRLGKDFELRTQITRALWLVWGRCVMIWGTCDAPGTLRDGFSSADAPQIWLSATKAAFG